MPMRYPQAAIRDAQFISLDDNIGAARLKTWRTSRSLSLLRTSSSFGTVSKLAERPSPLVLLLFQLLNKYPSQP